MILMKWFDRDFYLKVHFANNNAVTNDEEYK